MANIIIKSDERKANEMRVLREFARKTKRITPEQREYAETIVARVKEVKK